MREPWNSALPWAPHQSGLAKWSAERWGWKPGDPDWPAALALVVCAEDEGHTALDWLGVRELWDRRFGEVRIPFPEDLPGPDSWPTELFTGGWLHRNKTGGADLIQTARNAALEARLLEALVGRAAAGGAGLSTQGQEAALERAGKVKLLLLTGGPGTGKTWTLQRLVERWSSAVPGLRTVIAAPTGRAAARVRQSFAAAEAVPGCVTLHRLLGLPSGMGEAWHGRHRPLPFDLVIVDEASMLDLRTAVALCEALPPEAALILVGDPGQLPSVEAGAVLSDLLKRPELASCTVRLTQRFRLAQKSRTLAQVFDLLQQAVDDPAETAEQLRVLGAAGASDFRWEVTAEDEDPGPRALAAWGGSRGLSVETLGQSVLLSPVHGGPGGTLALDALADRSLGRLPGTIAEGLPWMICRNLPHLDLHNGDRGLLVRRDGRLWFETGEPGPARWPFSLVSEDGEAAWAVTVHKSQGSEYDRVVLVLPPGSSSGAVRELLYTGLTRAKTSAVLVASALSVTRALGRRADRQTGL